MIKKTLFSGTAKTKNKEKQPMSKQQKFALLSIIILACIIIFQLFSLSNQQTILHEQQNVTAKSKAQLQQVEEIISQTAQKNIQAIQKSIQPLNDQLSTLEKTTLRNNTQITTQLQQLQMQLEQTQKQVKALEVNAKEKPQKPASTTTKETDTQTKSTNAAKANLQVSSQYRIYSINSYGLVLEDTNGNYIIATIGKNLPNAGDISSITADQVIAGDYQIIANPPGFKADLLNTASTY
ncbi:hypothetical protein [Facilibium subflavum]|uniref:hypothetical protein n=1 Tax=Facilibium subflavum TaxID=2219058 RepID=UPI000E656556|nr:hypothetical protein [Facilibium subflavum]